MTYGEHKRLGVLPVRVGHFLRLAMAGELGPHGFLEARRVHRSCITDARPADGMHVKLVQAPDARSTFFVEYASGPDGCGEISTHHWAASLRPMVDRPAGSPVLFGHWRNEVPGRGYVALMAVDVPEELHRLVALGRSERLQPLFSLLSMDDRIEVRDESQSRFQRNLTVYFDGMPVALVDNTRRGEDRPHPVLGFAVRSVEQARSEVKTWFVQRHLRFTSGMPHLLFEREFDNLRVRLIATSFNDNAAHDVAQLSQAVRERAQTSDCPARTPSQLRQRP